MNRDSLKAQSAMPLAVAIVALWCAAVIAADAPPSPHLEQATESVPRGVAQGEPIAVPPLGSVVPVEGQVQAINLETAWRLAGVQNPTINIARLVVQEAEAVQRKARLVWIPNFNTGADYHSHVGALIASGGQIRRLDEQSLYFGGGARTVAAESNSIPAIQFVTQLSDAFFEPLAAHRKRLPDASTRKPPITTSCWIPRTTTWNCWKPKRNGMHTGCRSRTLRKSSIRASPMHKPVKDAWATRTAPSRKAIYC